MSERRRLVLVLVMSLGVASVAFLGLPLLYLTLPNPQPVQVRDISAAGRGIYVTGDDRAFRLFPLPSPQERPPESSPTLSRAGRIIIVRRQPGDTGRYLLLRDGSTRVAVPVSMTRHQRNVWIELHPARLADGIYELSLPKESMYGGTDYVYFSIRR